MGHTRRNAAINIASKKLLLLSSLPKGVEKFNFYQLVELLHSITEQDPESEEWESLCRLVFSANPSLGFAITDVSSLMIKNEDKIQLQTNFFGLSGAQSPLPGFILEELACEGELSVRKQFFDFFNNRLINLAYRIWRKYRYYVRFQEEAQDKFSAQLFSLVGLADPDMRGETPINWCKMLAYAGTLASRSRSPQVVAGILSHCFDLENVSIREWVKRKVLIQDEQKLQLGKKNSSIGVNTVIGDNVLDIKGKFIIEIKSLSREQFSDFLPKGKEFLPLCKLMEFIMRDQMSYDLELELKDNEAPSLVLGNDNVSLGWSSFLGENQEKKRVVIQVRE